MAYFHADSSRGAKVPQGIIGKDFGGLLITDFYGSYNGFKHTQKCLVHFLRDIKKELAVAPEEYTLQRLKRETKALIKAGKAIQALDDSKAGNKKRARKIKAIYQRLKRIMALTSDNKRTQTLIKRVSNYEDAFINFIHYPNADYHNNHAEQTIRFIVIFRKLSFGNRTEEGARLFGVLASVFATCRREGIYKIITPRAPDSDCTNYPCAFTVVVVARTDSAWVNENRRYLRCLSLTAARVFIYFPSLRNNIIASTHYQIL